MTQSPIRRIRAVPNEAPEPLGIDDLQKIGNAVVTDLRREAIRAIRASANGMYLNPPYTVANLQQMQRQAQEAAEAWQEVGAIAAGLLDKVQRAKAAHQ